MLNTDSGWKREKLRFKEEVINNFSYLINEFDFNVVTLEITFVRYESDDVFVNVYHGRMSFELQIELGLIKKDNNEPEYKFYMSDILELAGVVTEKEYKPFQVSTIDGVKKFVPILAEQLKKYASRALIGDADYYADLEKIRAVISERTCIDYEKRRIKPLAELAWKNKEYNEFIKLVEPIEEFLSPTEIKKADYARKHIEQ